MLIMNDDDDVITCDYLLILDSFQPSLFLLTCSLLACLSSARPGPLEFWLCTADFNPFNLVIGQPITEDRCEVVTNPGTASDSSQNEEDRNKPIIRYFG